MRGSITTIRTPNTDSLLEVALREVRDADLPILYEHQLDPEATSMAAFPSRDWEAFTAHYARILSDETVQTRTIVTEGLVVGSVVSWENDDKRLVGYWIGRDHWGKGIATRALEGFVKEVIDRPLHAQVAKTNIGSIRVLEKCGFEICAGETRGDDEVIEILMRLDGR